MSRPADTRVTPDTTTPSGVRIAVEDDLAGLELTISDQTTGADSAELADGLGNTLTTVDISDLGPGDSFRIEHDLRAGQEYLVLINADETYDRGAYNEDPDWPYDGGSFQVLEGIWARDRSSTANFYAYTELTALPDDSNDDDDNEDVTGSVDRPADTRVTPDTTTPSGVRIAVEDDLAGLELTISDQTTGVDSAELADGLGNTLTTVDISDLGPGDSFQIEHDLRAGQEYLVLINANETYDRGAYNEDPDWPYDGGSFQVLEGIWARDRSSTANFYAYTELTALPDDSNDDDDNKDVAGSVDRPADTRVTPDTTTPSGVRIAVEDDLAGLELTISDQTTGVDSAELADGLGNTLTTVDISDLGSGDSFQIEHDLQAGQEYLVLINANETYDRGAYNEDPDWPYDG
ncbi:hypothetical protein, partial [Haloterrigena salifodinae]|uniref:hypothetical protein n=1 Tax=Haloterrigena salifodinae TaxID=2675099 RepID=UPI001B87D57A